MKAIFFNKNELVELPFGEKKGGDMFFQERKKSIDDFRMRKTNVIKKVLSKYGEIESNISATSFRFMEYNFDIFETNGKIKMLIWDKFRDIKSFVFTDFTETEAEKVFSYLYSRSLENGTY